MNSLGGELIDRLGISLLHSLWQGALVALALFVALCLMRHATAQLRYIACCLALAALVLLPLATFSLVRTQRPTDDDGPDRPSPLVTSAALALETAAALLPEELPASAEGENSSATAGAVEEAASYAEGRWLSSAAERLLLLLVAGWGCGVILLSCRALGGYLVACRLTHRLVEPLEETWQARVRGLAARLNVRAAVEIWQSMSIDAPCVVGCFRPVILVPASLMTGMSVAQIDAILAHELAHVRRYDFLVNAIQCAIEALLFYHPCTWWISARIRAEREHCCDDLAVSACGDALLFARALSRLEEQRAPARFALALTGGGSLLGRVRRIVGRPRRSDVVGGWLAGPIAIAVPLAAGAAWVYGRGAEQPFAATLSAPARFAAPADDLSEASAAEEQLFRETALLTKDLTRTLAAVTDAASAAAAAEKIVDLSRRHADLNRRLRALRQTMSAETEARLRRHWLAELEQSSRQLEAEVARIQKLPGAVDALQSSVLFAVIGLHAPADTAPHDVDFLVPFSGRPRPFARRGYPLETLIADHGAQRIVKVVVLGLPGDVYDEVYRRLHGLLPNLTYLGSGAGDTATVYLAPISDLDFFAAQIDLGDVASIDREKRVITVVADHSRLPALNGRRAVAAGENAAGGEQAFDVTSLGQRLLRHDHRAVGDLIAFGAEAEPTAIEYAAHVDRRVRRDALLVLKKVGTRQSLPTAIQALSDSEVGNRDLAWQIICRLPGAPQERAVIEAAAAALPRDADQAGRWLTAIGPAAEREVLRYARHDVPAVRRQVSSVLRAIGGRDSEAPLKQLCDDADASVSAAAGEAYRALARRLSVEE